MTIEHLDGDRVAISPEAMTDYVKARNMKPMTKAAAKAMMAEYDADIRAGGEPHYPKEAADFLKSSGDLPELPVAWWARDMHGETQVYTADEMRDYARKAIAAQTAQAVPNGWRQAIEKIMQGIGAGDHPDHKMASYEAELVRAHMDGLYDELEGLEKAAPPTQAPTPEFKGWYCAQCGCGVDASDVTFHEQHVTCGRVITDDVPPTQAIAVEAVQDAKRFVFGHTEFDAMLKIEFEHISTEGKKDVNWWREKIDAAMIAAPSQGAKQ